MFNAPLLIRSTGLPVVNPFYKEVDYTGNGSAGHAITGQGFQPDLVCPFQNDGGSSAIFHFLPAGFARAQLFPEFSNGGNLSDMIASFDSDGFTLPVYAGGQTCNESGKVYRSFNFKLRAKAFDIQSWSGNSTARTIAHNLGVVPDWIFVKRTDSGGNGVIYHQLMDATNPQHYEMDWAQSTVTKTADSSVWNDTAPTSSVFSLGIDNNNLVNVNGGQYIALLFAGASNRCVTGTYEGNGSATGPNVTCGITPSLVKIFKQSASANNVRWVYGNNLSTMLNNTGAEDTANYIDLVSGGFNVKTTNSDFNDNGATYVYTAWL